jgi:hypothetical protein
MDDVEKLEAAKALTPIIEYMNANKKPFPLELMLQAFKIPKSKFLKWMKNEELRSIFEQKSAFIQLEHMNALMERTAEIKPEFLLKTVYSKHFTEDQRLDLIAEATQLTEDEAVDALGGDIVLTIDAKIEEKIDNSGEASYSTPNE